MIWKLKGILIRDGINSHVQNITLYTGLRFIVITFRLKPLMGGVMPRIWLPVAFPPPEHFQADDMRVVRVAIVS
jgi:hypothetical protein